MKKKKERRGLRKRGGGGGLVKIHPFYLRWIRAWSFGVNGALDWRTAGLHAYAGTKRAPQRKLCQMIIENVSESYASYVFTLKVLLQVLIEDKEGFGFSQQLNMDIA